MRLNRWPSRALGDPDPMVFCFLLVASAAIVLALASGSSSRSETDRLLAAEDVARRIRPEPCSLLPEQVVQRLLGGHAEPSGASSEIVFRICSWALGEAAVAVRTTAEPEVGAPFFERADAQPIDVGTGRAVLVPDPLFLDGTGRAVVVESRGVLAVIAVARPGSVDNTDAALREAAEIASRSLRLR